VTTDLLARLLDELPDGRVLTDPVSMERYSHDEAEWAPHTLPLCVVRAESSEEVRIVVKACADARVPIVPRGAGTGLSGGANATDGCIVLSLERMARVLEINPLERLAVVQPGVVNDHLREAVAEHGLWYPPDPASSPWSTIGGNAATNAGGLCCVKYGVTRDYVLALEVVTANGELIRIGHRTAKGVAGLDLVGLLVGSEGTLGIITEVTVRLRPLPPPATTVAGFFSSVVDAGSAVREVSAAGITTSALELVDRTCLQAVDAWKNMGLAVDAEVVLLARIDEPGAEGDRLADGVVECFLAGGATWADRSTNPDEAETLFAARRLAYPALERLGPVLTEDVCLPLAAVPEMLGRIAKIAETHDLTIANVAHAGDGNLHPMILTSSGDVEARTRAQSAFEEILDEALRLGGTVTGEHGVGLLKRAGVHRELSEPVLRMHTAIKDALDPDGILNPGKAY
jgi:glycolate oxidase